VTSRDKGVESTDSDSVQRPDSGASGRGYGGAHLVEREFSVSVTETQDSLASVRFFEQLSKADVPYAGGKGANLGELTGAHVPVPPGFVIGAPAYAAFCDGNGLRDRIASALADLDPDDPEGLERHAARVREMIAAEPLPENLADAIVAAYANLTDGDGSTAVAVRSSATAEDTESASFAGMNETFLNVRGPDQLLDAVRRCWASLFGARTVFYRAKRGFPQAEMDIAVVVQRQIRSLRAGVMFTIDPASGESQRIVIEGAFGLGESVVSGSVSPDRYVVDKGTLAIVTHETKRKELAIEPAPDGGTSTRLLSDEEGLAPVLTDGEVQWLAQLGIQIEQHYGQPQDTEWAFDEDGQAWMLQSRPITSAGGTAPAVPTAGGEPLVRGLGAAPGAATGRVRVLKSLADAGRLGEGEVLVTHMTAPDWVPLMRRAAAIVTDSGGMTCHAAIVSRELGLPCVVGTGDATSKLRDGELVTVDATQGVVLEGSAPAQAARSVVPASAAAPARVATATKLLVNLSEPSQVEKAAALDVDGVGLLRAELMVIEALEGTHPRLLIEEGRTGEFVERMTAGLTAFAAGFAPRPVTYRTIDFRTNEFRGLEGGERFEPEEANPMIGFRGALRYTRDAEVFQLELEAVRRVWDAGHDNFHVMLPFVRTARELARCRDLIEETGLLGRPGFELWVMAEVPSVLFNLERYAALGVAGISIGSNDLTQLMLGADRDSELVAEVFDERDPAVADYLRELIPRARSLGLATSICGQAPSVYPEYTDLLVRAGIDAISVNMDVVDRTRGLIASAEQRVVLEAARGDGRVHVGHHD
jgi:pyruvate, water dikinase